MISSDIHDDLSGISNGVADIFETAVPSPPECGLSGDAVEAELRAEKRLLFEIFPESCFTVRLCSFGTPRSISRISDASAKVVDGGFQQHFSEL